MSENPFSSKPTIVDEVEDEQNDTTQDDEQDPLDPVGVKEDYDEVDTMGEEVEDDEGLADEEWAQTPTSLFASLDQEKFWWVFVTLKEDLTESGNRRGIPVVQERFDSYEELMDARDDTDEAVPEGIHVQSKSSSKVRYVKGEDEQILLERRDLA
ncbi:hypothetical protein HVTV-2_gp51 [Haloarcula virus HVTV-2]|uniref:Uncharacterized protein n=1 Tax=Haloarcula vallismortis tailed virus 1 TaxID=1262528 RepID=L7THV5_9CAUD|nr:hypothetical protein HVTV1_51 [Haloarcula vallismortis tailed virus 1]AGC34421.1 hypothetical protein HVTV1_51 [Haloarcula vallismortis tailed virus 1]UBF22858.1 hypothetical protein HVTV-2_gp51 [Haloarcula virus HVTV-2]